MSFAGGLFLPIAFYNVLDPLLGYLEPVSEKAANVIAVAFLWPLFLGDGMFPPPPSCSSCGPTDAALVTAIITYLLFYSAVTYVAQDLITKWWSWIRIKRTPAPLTEGHA